MVRPMLIDLNLDKLLYPFIINMNRCDGSCSTVEDPFGRICVPNKMEDMNLKVFNMIKGINESKTLTRLISCDCRCESDGGKRNSRQKWNNDKCQCECKKPIKHRTCKEDYAWNSSTCACECYKDCDISEYSKDCKFMKSLVDDLVVTCDKTEDTPESEVINLSNRINDWLIVVLLAIKGSVLPVDIIGKYNMKRGLTIPCLLSY